MSVEKQEVLSLKRKYSLIPSTQFDAIVSYACRAVAFWEQHQGEILSQAPYQKEMNRYFQNLVQKLNDVEEAQSVELEYGNELAKRLCKTDSLTLEEEREVAAAQLEACKNTPDQLAKINGSLGLVNANLERLALWFENWAPRRGDARKGSGNEKC